jgi:hypothetical protein
VQSAAATATGETSMQVTWAPPACQGSSRITAYTVAINAAVTVPQVAVTDPFQSSYATAITGLTACTSYAATITATNAAGVSQASTVNVQTACSVPSPSVSCCAVARA